MEGGSARNMRVARVGSPVSSAPVKTIGPPPAAHVGVTAGVPGVLVRVAVRVTVAVAPPPQDPWVR